MINEKSIKIYQANRAKGFWDDCESIPERMEQASFPVSEIEAVRKAFKAQKLMLTVSELAEALEADRKDRIVRTGSVAKIANAIQDDAAFSLYFKDEIKDTYEDELADAFIRILDQCGGYGIDIESHVRAKLRFNSLRPHKHGKSY